MIHDNNYTVTYELHDNRNRRFLNHSTVVWAFTDVTPPYGLYYTILYYTILYYTILYSTKPCFPLTHLLLIRLLTFTDGVSDQSSGLRKLVIVDKERGISQHNASVTGYHVVESFDPPLPATPNISPIKQTLSYRIIYPIQVRMYVCGVFTADILPFISKINSEIIVVTYLCAVQALSAASSHARQ